MRVAALDIGGSKLAAALVGASNQVGEVTSIATPATEEAACLSAVHALLEPLLGDADVIGVCSAGPFTRPGSPRPVNIAALANVELAQHLTAWSERPVVVVNDAQALAVAEGICGAARGRANHAVVTVSTGVGAGIVLEGRLVTGRTGNAGHLGHVQVDPTGPRCPCGRRGCLETLISGTAVARRTGHPAAEASADVIAAAAAVLGTALTDLVTLFDLELVTLAGSVALGWGESFRGQVQQVLREEATFDYVRRTCVALSELGVASGLIGAAVHARQQLAASRSAVLAQSRCE
jgi:glucokinase